MPSASPTDPAVEVDVAGDRRIQLVTWIGPPFWLHLIDGSTRHIQPGDHIDIITYEDGRISYLPGQPMDPEAHVKEPSR